MGLILKALGGITALILLVITLLGSVITLGGFLARRYQDIDYRYLPGTTNRDHLHHHPRPLPTASAKHRISSQLSLHSLRLQSFRLV